MRHFKNVIKPRYEKERISRCRQPVAVIDGTRCWNGTVISSAQRKCHDMSRVGHPPYFPFCASRHSSSYICFSFSCSFSFSFSLAFAFLRFFALISTIKAMIATTTPMKPTARLIRSKFSFPKEMSQSIFFVLSGERNVDEGKRNRFPQCGKGI